MKLHWLAMKGLTRFDRNVEVDFDAIGPGVIAVRGSNGNGKTTLLEATLPAVIYREMPTRQPSSLPASTRPEGSRILLDFSLEADRYLADVSVDSRGTQTAKLTRNDQPLVSGKVREYDAWVEENIGPKSAAYASVYGMQGGGGRFGSLSVRDRKEIFRYYLRLDVVAAMHASAEAKLSSVKATLAALDSTKRALEAAEADIPLASDDLQKATRHRNLMEADVLKARRVYEAALQEAAGAQGLITQIAQRTAVVARLAAIKKRLVAAKSRLATVVVPPTPVDLQVLQQAAEDVGFLKESLRKEVLQLAKADGDLARKKDNLEQARADVQRMKDTPCEGKRVVDKSKCRYLQAAHQASTLLPSLQQAYDLGVKEQRRLTTLCDEIRGALEVVSEKGDPVAAYAQAKQDLAVRESALREQTSLQRDVDTLQGDMEEELKALAGFPADLPESPPSTPNVEALRQVVRTADGHLSAAERAMATAAAALEDAKKRKASCEKALETMAAQAADADALGLAAKALGPNGIQAYEIDAAGPRVSELVNDLLEACYGPRFSVQIVTQKELASREGTKEDFAVMVHDSTRDGAVDIGSLSGGEKCIVDEALGVGMALFSNEQLVRPFRTLWRDEFGSGLDEENQERYVEMLRRARTLGGFHQILASTHSDVVGAGAAAVIWVNKGGRITVNEKGD